MNYLNCLECHMAIETYSSLGLEKSREILNSLSGKEINACIFRARDYVEKEYGIVNAPGMTDDERTILFYFILKFLTKEKLIDRYYLDRKLRS